MLGVISFFRLAVAFALRPAPTANEHRGNTNLGNKERTETPKFYIYDEEALTNTISRDGWCLEPQAESKEPRSYVEDLLFLNLLRTHGSRVDDPTAAQLFVVPLIAGNLCECPDALVPCNQNPVKYAHAIDTLQKGSFFRRYRGKDHITFAYHYKLSAWAEDQKQIPSAWWGAVNYTIATRYELYNYSVYDRAALTDTALRPKSLVDEPWERTRQTVVLPLSSAQDGSPVVRPSFDTWSQRRLWIFYRTRRRPSGHGATALRHGPIDFGMGNWANSSVGYDITSTRWLDDIQQSQFALVIRGDTPGSHALANAIKFGCIPVIISDSLPLVLPVYSSSGEGLSLQDFTISIPEAIFLKDPGAALSVLKHIQATGIRDKLENLRRAQELFLYDAPGTKLPDLVLRAAYKSASKWIPDLS